MEGRSDVVAINTFCYAVSNLRGVCSIVGVALDVDGFEPFELLKFVVILIFWLTESVDITQRALVLLQILIFLVAEVACLPILVHVNITSNILHQLINVFV